MNTNDDEIKEKLLNLFRKYSKGLNFSDIGCIRTWEDNDNGNYSLNKDNSIFPLSLGGDYCKLKNIGSKDGSKEFKPFFISGYDKLNNVYNYYMYGPEKPLGLTTYINPNMKIFNPLNSTSYKISKNGAMTSLVHILVIPNPTWLRRYNVVTLRRNDIEKVDMMAIEGLKVAILQRQTIIQKLIEKRHEFHFGKENKKNYQVTSRLPGGNNKHLSQDWLFRDNVIHERNPDEYSSGSSNMDINRYAFKMDGKSYLETFCDPDWKPQGGNISPTLKKHFRLSESPIPGGQEVLFPEAKWKIGFHVHPNHSVGSLHLHIFDENLLTHNGEHNVEKTIPWFEVKEILKLDSQN